jgi:hypothetical protein
MDLATGVYIQNWSQKSLQVAAQRQASILWENARTLVMNKTYSSNTQKQFECCKDIQSTMLAEGLEAIFMFVLVIFN